MDQKIKRRSFFILTLAMIYTSILALDTNRPLCKTTGRRRQSSNCQNSQATNFRLPELMPNHNIKFESTVFPKKVSKIQIDSSLLMKRVSNSTLKSESQDKKRRKEIISFEDDLLLSSASNGKERKNSLRSSDNTNSDDDDKKTLSQQVKEGKYGLIQNEIFQVKPERPGIISYLPNSEVPQDTIKNLGGLDEEDIWLAENHVLVLKGGSFPDLNLVSEHTTIKWAPIDNYKAPRRQVKIPAKPKIPPPFPVQLVDGGPIHLIGTNGSTVAENATTINFDALPDGFRGFLPGKGPFFQLMNPRNNDVTSGLLGAPKKNSMVGGVPAPIYPALPPGAVIVPPPSNQTDYDDEDQSIYYPPPYSFTYKQDNFTSIPPGPLVPGIILPPPPDFFSAVDEDESADTNKHAKNSNTSSMTPSRPSYLPPRKSNTKLNKVSLVTTPTVGSKTISYHPKPFARTKLANSTFNEYHSVKTLNQKYKAIPSIEVTTPVPVKSTTLESSENYQIKQVLGNQIVQSSTEKTPWRSVINNNAVPLVTFFATTKAAPVEQTVETTPPSIKTVLTTDSPPHSLSQASYYFYEESNNEDRQTTSNPLVFFETTSEAPPYYKYEQSQVQRQKDKKEFYDVEMIPSQQTAQDYNVKLLDSIDKDEHLYRYLDSSTISSQEKLELPPIKEHKPRRLHSEPIYYQPLPVRLAPKLSYFATQKPKKEDRKPQTIESFEYKSSPSKSKPIYQYSFEATNYAKPRERSVVQKLPIPKKQQHRINYQPIYEPRHQKQLPLYTKYQDNQNLNDHYDYDTSNVVSDQPIRALKTSYGRDKKNERLSYYQQPTTASPMRITTLASHQQYFTKQDEQLLDDVTKEYFTAFGKKLSDKLPSTTPVYGKSSVTEKPIFNNVNDYKSLHYNGRETNAFRVSNIKVRYGDQTPGPFTGPREITINYEHPQQSSPLDPSNGFISLLNLSPQSGAIAQKARPQALLQVGSQVRDYAQSPITLRQHFDPIQSYGLEHQKQNSEADLTDPFKSINAPKDSTKGYSQRPHSLEGDIAINYKDTRPPVNLDAEYIDVGVPSHVNSNIDKPNSYFAYRLPGEGGHFYFLTPQAVRQEDPNGAYLYSKQRPSRLLKKRRR